MFTICMFEVFLTLCMTSGPTSTESLTARGEVSERSRVSMRPEGGAQPSVPGRRAVQDVQGVQALTSFQRPDTLRYRF